MIAFISLIYASFYLLIFNKFKLLKKKPPPTFQPLSGSVLC